MSLRRALLLALLIASTGCGSSGGTVAPAARIELAGTADMVRGVAGERDLLASGFAAGSLTWRLVGGELPPGLGLEADVACPTWAPFADTGALDDTVPGVLDEVSGIAVSRRNPGIYWVHDDSGGGALLHALTTAGVLRQTYALGVTAVDWEDLALGPGPDPALEYLYVGDVGDNGTNRPHATLLRVEEPIVPAVRGPTIDVALEAFAFTYPDGAVDCEALFLAPDTGKPYFVEKRESGGGDVFSLPLPLDPSWTAALPVTAERITTGRPMPAFATAADASRDGRRVVVRTYFGGVEYVRQQGQPFESMFGAARCTLALPSLQQFEAIAYGPSGLSMVTTTERVFSEASLYTSTASLAGPIARLVGTPTAVGAWTFMVEARHDDSTTASVAITLEVSAGS
ncbi:MAG: hypothetical protein AB7T63_04345 [Planctomycetota bacterium]